MTAVASSVGSGTATESSPVPVETSESATAWLLQGGSGYVNRVIACASGDFRVSDCGGFFGCSSGYVNRVIACASGDFRVSDCGGFFGCSSGYVNRAIACAVETSEQ